MVMLAIDCLHTWNMCGGCVYVLPVAATKRAALTPASSRCI